MSLSELRGHDSSQKVRIEGGGRRKSSKRGRLRELEASRVVRAETKKEARRSADSEKEKVQLGGRQNQKLTHTDSISGSSEGKANLFQTEARYRFYKEGREGRGKGGERMSNRFKLVKQTQGQGLSLKS